MVKAFAKRQTTNTKHSFTLIELLVARHPKPWRRKTTLGFTLIELLVVITIIGILATLIVASFTTAQKKSRDTKRKSDLNAIKTALELAKGDSVGGAYYPKCDSWSACRLSDTSTTLDIAPTYIKSAPKDPRTNLNYTYYPQDFGGSCSANCTGFNLVAILENVNDPAADKDDITIGTSGLACGITSGSGTAKAYYVCEN